MKIKEIIKILKENGDNYQDGRSTLYGYIGYATAGVSLEELAKKLSERRSR